MSLTAVALIPCVLVLLAPGGADTDALQQSLELVGPFSAELEVAKEEAVEDPRIQSLTGFIQVLPMTTITVNEQKISPNDFKWTWTATKEDTKTFQKTPGVGNGIVYKVEVEKSADIADFVATTNTEQEAWGKLIAETDALLRSEQREIQDLQAIILKVYNNRLAVSDSNDSERIRSAGTYDYVNMLYQARKVLCKHSNCNYGVCFLKDINNIDGIQLDAAIALMNADWQSRVENPNVAFKRQGSNVVVQQNSNIRATPRVCDVQILLRGFETIGEEKFCSNGQDIYKEVWIPYIYQPKDIALIQLMYRYMGVIMPTRESLKDLAMRFTVCACYKGFHGTNCDHCVCSDTPGIYDIPVANEIILEEPS